MKSSSADYMANFPIVEVEEFCIADNMSRQD